MDKIYLSHIIAFTLTIINVYSDGHRSGSGCTRKHKKTIGMEPAPMAQWFSYSLCTREIPGSVPGGDRPTEPHEKIIVAMTNKCHSMTSASSG